MASKEDLIGRIFVRLTVIRKSLYQCGQRPYWVCQCECGNITCVRGDHLSKGEIRSCGCLSRELTKERNSTHGYARVGKANKYYTCYNAVIGRCYNKNNAKYARYGGRGITLYTPWIDDPAAFIEYIKALPNSTDLNLSLDRINNDGNYEPGNLRWATDTQQANNKGNNLTPQQIKRVQGKLWNSCWTRKRIAKFFGVDFATIAKVQRRMSDAKD